MTGSAEEFTIPAFAINSDPAAAQAAAIPIDHNQKDIRMRFGNRFSVTSLGSAVGMLALVAVPAFAGSPAGDPAKGKALYEGTCIACHGSDGKGAFDGVPDFTKKDGRLTKADDVLLKHIKNGFQSPGSFMAMPPKGGNPDLSDKDLADILAYIRHEFGDAE